MKKLFYILFFLSSIGIYGQDTIVWLGNTDRQKIDSLFYANDTLGIKIENDELKKVRIVSGGGLQTTDIDTFIELDAIVADETLAKVGDFVDLGSSQIITSGFKSFNGNIFSPQYYFGYSDGTSGRRWRMVQNNVSNLIRFDYQDVASTDPDSGSFTTMYTMDPSGTPSAATDLIDKAYADANYAGGGSLPVDDTTALVQDPVDNTKQVRIDAGAITTATTRTIIMPDFNVDLGALTGNNIADGTLSGADLANSTITNAKIDDLTMKPIKLETGVLPTDTQVPTYNLANDRILWVDQSSISGTDDQTASEVNITDSGGNYTGTTVEDALTEVADSISVKISSYTGAVSGSSAIPNIVQKAYSRSEAAPPAGTTLIQTDVPIVETLTGASLDFADVPFYLDNQTADNNITFTGMAAWMEGVIDIDQASEPTFTAAGYTVSAWDGTLAFASNTPMRYIFQVQPDGSTIKFYRLTL